MRGIKKPKGLGRVGGLGLGLGGGGRSARLVKPAKMKPIAVPRSLGRGPGAAPSLTGSVPAGGRGRRKKPGIL